MIKQMHQNLFCQISLFIALTFGLTFGNSLHAQECYDSTNYISDDSQNAPLCELPCNPSIFDSKAVLILGSSLIAAGVGAGIALAVQNGRRGPSGDDGTNGATGPAGVSFIADPGQTLTFSYTMEVLALEPGAVIPFVTAPDGTTVEGASVPYPAGSTLISIPNVVISNPLFGFYNTGLQLISTDLTATYNVRINVLASRDGSTTYLPVGSGDTVTIPATTPLTTEAQLDATFSYDPANVP